MRITPKRCVHHLRDASGREVSTAAAIPSKSLTIPYAACNVSVPFGGKMGSDRFSLLDENLREFGIIVRRNLRFLIWFAIVTAVLVVLITAALPRYWRLAATIQVKGRQDSSILAMIGSSMGGFQLPSPATETEMQLLRTRLVREQAIVVGAMQIETRNRAWDTVHGRLLRFFRDKLPLVPDVPAEYLLLSQAEIEPGWAGKKLVARVSEIGSLEISAPGSGEQIVPIGGRFNVEGLAFTLDEVHAPAGRKFSLIIHPKSEMLRIIDSNSGVYELGLNSGVLAVVLFWPDPYRGSMYVNSLAEAYFKNNEEYSRILGEDRLEYLDEEIDRVRNALLSSEKELAEYKLRESTVVLTEESKALIQSFATRKLEQEEITMELEDCSSLLLRLGKGQTEDFILYSGALRQDPVQTILVQQLAELVSERVSLLEEMTEVHPEVVKNTALIEEVKSSILGNLRNRKKTLETGRASTGKVLAEYDALMAEIPQKERDLMVLARDREVNERLYYFLVTKRQETAVLVESQTTSVRMLDEAIPPDFPARPSIKVNGFLALIFGFLFALAYVSLRVYGSGRVRGLRHALALGAGGHIALIPRDREARSAALDGLAAEVLRVVPAGGSAACIDLADGIGAELASELADRLKAAGAEARLVTPSQDKVFTGEGAVSQNERTVLLLGDLVAHPLQIAAADGAALRIVFAAAGQTTTRELRANAAILGGMGAASFALVAGDLETEDAYTAMTLDKGVRISG